MKKAHRAYLAASLLLGILVVGFSTTGAPHSEPKLPERSRSAAAELTTEQAFDLMMEVLTHKRCVNCHPSDDYPRQGEDSHVHNFGVQRGPDNHGVAALQSQNAKNQPS